ncbi:MAG TPA: O-antigen ligase family protein [Sediminibacterium sp.]|nr:O-antigen ligase family protein [Sediminibacterium sp.]
MPARIQQYGFYLLFTLLFAGLLCSRALLSISTILLTAWAVLQLPGKSWQKEEKWLLYWNCCPLALWCLGAWQQPLAAGNFNYLTSLLAYPAACLTLLAMDSTTRMKILSIGGIFIFLSVLYPVSWYLLHQSEAWQMIGRGQALPVGMEGDHLRYGILLCLAFLCWLLFSPLKGWSRASINGMILLLVAFLSVRTAWVLSLLLLISWWWLSSRQPRKLATAAGYTGLLIGLLLLAYLAFPTLQQKWAYMRYDWQQHGSKGRYDLQFSDGARAALNAAAWQTISEDPGIHTGWAAVPAALQERFQRMQPGSHTAYGWPFNQYLYWWMGSGWWGMGLEIIWLLFPMFYGIRHKNTGLVCWTAAIAVSCLVESNLLFQYGIFLHAWPIAFLWQEKEE